MIHITVFLPATAVVEAAVKLLYNEWNDVKEVAQGYESTENYHPTLQFPSALWSFLASFWSLCWFYSPQFWNAQMKNILHIAFNSLFWFHGKKQ